MKVILYMATSINGKTTGLNDDTSWVEETDVERMDALMKNAGVMLMGSGTYHSFGDDLPSDQAVQVVMTNKQALLETKVENVIFTNEKPVKVLEMISKKGFSKVILAGGEKINTSFLEENLIDEIKIIVKPIIIGEGKSLFSSCNLIQQFSFSKFDNLDNGAVELTFVKESK